VAQVDTAAGSALTELSGLRVVVCVEQPDGDPAHADLHAAEQPADQRNQRLQPQRLRRAGSPLLGRALAGCRRSSACTRLQDEHEAGYLDPRVLPPRHRHPHTLESAVHQPQPEDRKRRICRRRVDLHVLDLEDARAQPNRAVVEVEDRPKQELEQAAEERSHPSENGRASLQLHPASAQPSGSPTRRAVGKPHPDARERI